LNFRLIPAFAISEVRTKNPSSNFDPASKILLSSLATDRPS
jgi:hypothetical protein